MDITIDTPVEEVLASPKRRQEIIKLAQLVFDRPTVATYRAFSQFRSEKDVATLIVAKRKNVFDYGMCIHIDNKGAARYPSNPAAIMAVVNQAMDGDFDSAMASAGFGTDEDYGYYGD